MDYNLDSLQLIKNLDKSGVSHSIGRLGDQLLYAWNGIRQLDLPEAYSTSQNIILSGMGGSALGGRIIESTFFDLLRAPFVVSTENMIPHWANANSLVIISSYSGNTEETVESLRDAQKKRANIVIISSGGKLAEIAEKEAIPAFIFDDSTNPSGQPRMALGLSLGSLLGLLSSLQFISLSHEDIENAAKASEKAVEDYGYGISTSKNLAKLQAQKLHNRFLIGVASEHLKGVAYTFKNQLNENAKTYSNFFDLPELNHHLLEGLRFPEVLKSSAHFLFFESDLYKEEYKKRYEITKDVVNQNGFVYSVFKLQSKTKIEQVFESLVFASYVSLYLALLYGIDPAPIPWVDYFKKKL